MKKLRSIVLLCMAAILIGGIGAYAVGSYGSESDPLITLSYLEKVLKPELEKQFSEETDELLQELKQEQTQGGGSYSAVTVKAGQTMTCKTGCEFLVRSGSAYVSSGMLNVTAGTAPAKNDWLQAHNLYMAVIENATVTATGDTSLMVRGEYTIQ